MSSFRDSPDKNDPDPRYQTPTDLEDPHVNIPLREALRQYSKVTWWILGISTVIILWGYDLAVVGAVSSLDPFQRDFGQFDKIEDGEEKWIIPGIWLSIWQAMPSVGQLAGALAAGPMMDKLGRKKCILFGAVIVTLSVLLEFMANRMPSKEGMRRLFLAGKIIQGFATALIKMATLTWVSEIVPTCLRGASMMVFPSCNLVGQFIGAVLVFGINAIKTDMGYLVALGVQWIFSIAPLLVAIYLPESPAYLVRQKRMDEAKHSIDCLFAPKNDTDAILEKFRVLVAEEERLNEGISYISCFKGTQMRRTWVAIYANFLPPLFGLPLVSSGSYFLQQLGMKNFYSLLFLVIGIVIGFIGNLGSTWTMTHVGRRRLTINSLLLIALLWAVMGILGCFPTAYNITQWISAALMMAIIFVAGVGVWTTSYVISSEVSSLRLRAKTQSIGGIAAYMASFVTNFALPLLYNPDQADLKALTGWVFFATSVLAALGTWWFVPEMLGRTPVEIDHLFAEKVSARKSAVWRDASVEGKAADF
jgi:SP family general alpha glucoside:H+ symporter-like MFS transporter